MLTVGFWNLHHNPKALRTVSELCLMASFNNNSSKEDDCIIIFSEHDGIDMNIALKDIISKSKRLWNIKPSSRQRFSIAYNLNDTDVIIENEIHRSVPIQITRIKNSAVEKISLIGVHLSSPTRKWRGNSHSMTETIKFKESLVLWESKSTTSLTILIGDFNQDPYSDSMISTDVLNAAMCKFISKDNLRNPGKLEGNKPIPYFYNPTWGLFGTRTDINVPGSFYNPNDMTDVACWHAIDQILMRPALIDRFMDNSLTYIHKINKFNLISKKGIPRKSSFSDHLPIMAKWRV